MITAWVRGWQVTYDADAEIPAWRFIDTGALVYVAPFRPCAECGEPPSEQGYDACLGHLDGVRAACCGHGGRSRPYILFGNGTVVELAEPIPLRRGYPPDAWGGDDPGDPTWDERVKDAMS